jgi:hypothetical protein
MTAATIVHYCSGCGSYTELDEDSKLCRECYKAWRAGAAVRVAMAEVEYG